MENQEMAENIANQIARQLYAMSAKKKEASLVESLRNERYQRTFTDEHYELKDRGRFRPVPQEQKDAWKILAGK